MGVDYPLDLMLATPQVHPIRGVGRKHSSTVSGFFKDHVAAHPPPPTGKHDFSSLPEDLRHNIIAEVASASSRRFLPRYATVSREWQAIIERITFAELYLTDGRVLDFGNIMNPRRQSSMRHVMCHVMLGLYASHNARETTSQHRESTRVLNDYITRLFTTMSKWRVEDAGPAGIQLKVVVNSPSDEPASSSSLPGDHRQSRRARAALARIDIPSESLPSVPVISGLSAAGRHLELASVTLLVSKLPNLMTLDIEMEHDTRDLKDVEQRAEFISSLAYYAPHMAHLRLHRPINHVDSTKSPSREQRALFHTRLRNFTQRCATVGFDDCVYAREFLAPFASDLSAHKGDMNGNGVNGTLAGHAKSLQSYRNQAGDLWWPYLRKLHIRNSYMLRRPYLRVSTRSAALMIIHEVLLLAGRAIAHMPALEEVRVRQYVLASGRLETILIEYKAGSGSGGKKMAPRLKVKGLRPSVPAIDAWRESVRSTKGSHLVIELDNCMDY